MLPARLSGRVRLTSEFVSKPAPPVLFVGSACGFSPCPLSSGHLMASSEQAKFSVVHIIEIVTGIRLKEVILANHGICGIDV